MENKTIPDNNISEDYVSKKSPSTWRILEEFMLSIISKKYLNLSKESPIWKSYLMVIHIDTKRAAKACWLKDICRIIIDIYIFIMQQQMLKNLQIAFIPGHKRLWNPHQN